MYLEIKKIKYRAWKNIWWKIQSVEQCAIYKSCEDKYPDYEFSIDPGNGDCVWPCCHDLEDTLAILLGQTRVPEQT